VIIFHKFGQFIPANNNIGTTHQPDHEEHFKMLSCINTAPVPIVLSTYTPTQIEPSFIIKKCEFGSRIAYCHVAHKSQFQKCVLSHNHIIQLTKPVLFYMASAQHFA
jgi:hypothetical protein